MKENAKLIIEDSLMQNSKRNDDFLDCADKIDIANDLNVKVDLNSVGGN